VRSPAARAYALREAIELALVIVGLAVASRFLHVPLWAWVALPLGKLLFSVAAYGLLLRRSFERRHATGPLAVVGKTGVVVTPLRPRGQVRVGGEIWQARGASGRDHDAGTIVRIAAIEGSTLFVERVDEERRGQDAMSDAVSRR
jgi:membrane protein implicated in regulation of membrane protease activity